jgi:hypothetical protein
MAKTPRGKGGTPVPPSDHEYTWKKGQSGNPSGVSKIALRARQLAAQSSEEAIEFLASVVRNEKSVYEPKEQIQAAKVVLEWGVPKPAPERNMDAENSFFERFAAIVTSAKTQDVEDDDDEE